MSLVIRSVILSFMVITFLLSNALAQGTRTILLFGDSIIAGYGLPAEQSVPVHVQEILQSKGHQVTVINGGVSGNTTTDGKNRLSWTLDQYHPDLVLLGLGANDMLRGVPPAVARKNLEEMLNLLATRKIPTVFSAVQAAINMGPAYSTEFNRIYPELASQYRVPLYPFLLQSVFGRSALMLPDGVHPNAEGTKVIAQELADYFDKNFF